MRILFLIDKVGDTFGDCERYLNYGPECAQSACCVL